MSVRRTSVQRFLRAFTLVEVMVCLAIIATLLAISLYYWRYMLLQRQMDSDYKQLGQLLTLAGNQGRQMGSAQGNIQTCSGASPLVYVSLAPAATAATSVVVYYQAMEGGAASTAPLESLTLSPNDVMSMSPAPDTNMILFSPSPGVAGGYLNTYDGANATPIGTSVTVTIQAMAGGTPATSPPSKSFTWDSFSGGVTFNQ